MISRPAELPGPLGIYMSNFTCGDTEEGRAYQFIFKNISDSKTPSVSVSCEY